MAIKSYAEYLQKARARAKAYYDKRKSDPKFLERRAELARKRRAEAKKKTA